MTREGVVDPSAFGLRAGIVVDGRLWEHAEAGRDDDEVTDRLFFARVVRVEPTLAAAFLDIGGGRTAFLTARDARFLDPAREKRRIQDLLREGERLVVQGLREADDDKGPRVTADIRLFGLFVIYRPYGGEVRVSGRVRGREKAELHERAARLFPDGRVVLRRFAVGVPDSVLREEAQRLEELWRRIVREAAGAKPGPVAAAEDPFERILRFLFDREVERIAVAEGGLARRFEQALARIPERVRPQLHRVPGLFAFDSTGIREQFEEALGPEVALPGGGRIVVEETRALCAVDVDGEGRDPLELDLEAAREVARQMRLRNIGGNIVVDFVDLPRPSARKLLDDALGKWFRDDPAGAQIHPMSALGLVHIARACRGRPLSRRWLAPCGACGGSGRVPSLAARIEGLHREVVAARRPVLALKVGERLAAALAPLAGAPWLAGIVPQVDPALPSDGFRLEFVP
ncbi:Ribonuclease E [bacterium HR39]|nr:Ribonuclease E [bacterium HR39]